MVAELGYPNHSLPSAPFVARIMDPSEAQRNVNNTNATAGNNTTQPDVGVGAAAAAAAGPVDIPVDQGMVTPIRSQRTGSQSNRAQPYDAAARVSAAVRNLERQVHTPVPENSCSTEDLLKYVTSRFDYVEREIQNLKDDQERANMAITDIDNRTAERDKGIEDQVKGIENQAIHLTDADKKLTQDMVEVRNYLETVNKQLTGLGEETKRSFDKAEAAFNHHQAAIDKSEAIEVMLKTHTDQTFMTLKHDFEATKVNGGGGAMQQMLQTQVDTILGKIGEVQSRVDSSVASSSTTGGIFGQELAGIKTDLTDVKTDILMTVQEVGVMKLELTEIRQRMAQQPTGPPVPPGVSCGHCDDGCVVMDVHCKHVVNLGHRVEAIETYLGAHGAHHHVQHDAARADGPTTGSRAGGPTTGSEPPRATGDGGPTTNTGGDPLQRPDIAWNRYFPGGGPPGNGSGGQNGGGGHGPGGDGHGPRGNGHGGGGHWSQGTHDGHPNGHVSWEKIFDDKVAISQDYAYQGGTGGEQWRVRVKGYWVSKCPALLDVLDWAEKRDSRSISPDDILDAARTEGWTRWRAQDLQRINEILWGFLNMCLKGEAHRHFELAKWLNGLEAWRIIVQTIHRGRNNRHAALRKLIRNPQQIVKLEDVEQGITTFDNNLREYEACNGRRPDDADLKTDLLESLPVEIRENLLWRSSDLPDESYEAFRNHVKMQANSVLYHRGKLRGQVNAVEGEQNRSVELNERINGLGDTEELLGAIMRKLGMQPNGARTARPMVSAETRPPRKCINCGSEKHLGKDCPRGVVPMDKRPCFRCGECGHIGVNCKKGRPPIKALEEHDSSPTSFGGDMHCACVMEDQDFKTVTRSKPRPRAATVADFIPTATKNAFNALISQDEHEVWGAIGVPTDELRSETSCGDERSALRGNKKKKGRMLQRLMVAETINDNLDMFLEPNTHEDDLNISTLEMESDDEILNAEEEKIIEVAVDSGCVAHCAEPDCIPPSVSVKPPPPGSKNFVGAGGHTIKRYGKAEVVLEQENGSEVNNVFQVADVTRPLHSVSQIADTNKEILFTKGECLVVPEGALSRYLKGIKVFARYGRRGGLYLSRMTVRDPKKKREPRPKSGFARPGVAK